MTEGLREFIIRECEARNLSWRQASQEAGLDHDAISRYVNGTRPTRKSCRKLAAYFGVPEEQILVIARHMIPPQSFTPQTELEWQLLEKFREYDSSGQRFIISLVDLLVGHGILRPEEEHQSHDDRRS